MFKVWLKVRNRDTLELLETKLLYKSEDRLAAEAFIEQWRPVAGQTSFSRTAEMEMPQSPELKDVLENMRKIAAERDDLRVQLTHALQRGEAVNQELKDAVDMLDARAAEFTEVVRQRDDLRALNKELLEKLLARDEEVGRYKLKLRQVLEQLKCCEPHLVNMWHDLTAAYKRLSE